MRSKTFVTIALAVLAIGSVSSLWTDPASAQWRRWHRNASYNSYDVPAGTSFNVRLETGISTEKAQPGDTWSGTVVSSVNSGNQVMIPAGTPVEGVVTAAEQGTHNNRPQIDLAVRRMNLNGQSRSLSANTEPIVAGSNRAKKIGAIAGGAAVGALVGHTVAKGSHGTLIGGLLGGAAGYGLTRHAFRSMELKPGTVITFTTNEGVATRRY
jgi:hypothetical protein